jgi:hypothetical protein
LKKIQNSLFFSGETTSPTGVKLWKKKFYIRRITHEKILPNLEPRVTWLGDFRNFSPHMGYLWAIS